MSTESAPRVLLITGASRGIGAATALRAAQDGWDVAINCVHDTRAAEEVAHQVQACGQRAVVVQADVSQEDDVVRLFAEVDHRLGTLGGLVNNAAVVDLSQRVEEMSGRRLQRMLGINVVGSFLCAREAVRRMSRRHGGCGGVIVNISSAAARLGSPGQYVDYAASKGAIDTMTVGLAREVAAEGIRVNAVRPGIIDTEIHASSGAADLVQRLGPTLPMGRAGSAQEVAAAVVWLLSAQSSYTTGSILEVTGGR